MDSSKSESFENGILSQNALLSKTFFRMFLGLLATALASFYSYSSGLLETILMDGSYYYLFIAEIIVVLVFSLFFRKVMLGIYS